MTGTIRAFILAVVFANVAVQTTIAAQPQRSGKPLKIILKVESEGPEGLQVQSAKELSSAELKQLRSLIQGEIATLKDHRLVPPDEKGDAVGLVIVAGKYQNAGDSLILLSSVITIAKADGTDVFVSHDVIAARTLALAARAVAFYLASVEFRSLLGLLR
jgi:hypothetical protein